MTVTTPAATGGSPDQHVQHVSVSIDGVDISVPKGTLIIRAAELIGVAIPRFCDHPLLDPVAACRMCLIEVEGMPKPQPACAMTCGDGMVVRTQVSSDVALDSQRSVMEFLLINHPLDCPVCDKGGECPLQNQAMTNGQGETRFDGPKRTFPKPINLSAQVLLDRERCVSCARCTRFAEQIAGDPYIELLERGSQQQVGIADGRPFDSYFSGNTIQICPVGALTSAMYRFRSRPFDLVSTPTACEHCAAGCAQRTDTRRNSVMRRMAALDPEVNEEWNCDKGRFAFRYVESDDRLQYPLIREDGELRRASWSEAVDVAAKGLREAHGRSGVITGGRLSVQDALAYSTFARAVLKTNNVDFRSRLSSAEEEQFLASHVAGRGLGPTYADLEAAPAVVLVALEPEDESPIVMLRLRKSAQRGTEVYSVAPVATTGLDKMLGSLVATTPGSESVVVDSLGTGRGLSGSAAKAAAAVRLPGAVILVGERAAGEPGLLSAVARLAATTGARLAWVPRRAGDRGAVDAGLLPSLLPGGRPAGDATARVDAAAVWGIDSVPDHDGLDLPGMLVAATGGDLNALVVAGADFSDLPENAGAALAKAFVVSLDTRKQGVTEHADVVLPVAAAPEKAGSFINWEGRVRPFGQALRTTSLVSDARVLSLIAGAMESPLGPLDVSALDALRDEFAGWEGATVQAPDVAPTTDALAPDQLRLATWRPLLDHGVLQQGEPYLAATAHDSRVLIGARVAERVGVRAGDMVSVQVAGGLVTGRVDVVEAGDHAVGIAGVAPAMSGQAVSISTGGAR